MSFDQQAYNNEWKRNNRDKVNAYRRRHYQKYKDKVAAQNKKWVKKNPEKVRAIKARWKKLHPEIRRKHSVLYQKRHPDKKRKWAAESYRRNKDKILIRVRAWASKNKEKRKEYERIKRAKKQGSSGENCFHKIQLLKKERFCHWCCRPLDNSNRTIDHVIPLARGGRHIPDNLVAACKPCNFSKNDKLIEEWSWEMWEAA